MIRKTVNRRVNSKFAGKLWLHQKYVREALELETDLVLTHNKREMTIPFADIQAQRYSLGKELYEERFGKGFYRLCGFDWKPDPLPPTLF